MATVPALKDFKVTSSQDYDVYEAMTTRAFEQAAMAIQTLGRLAAHTDTFDRLNKLRAMTDLVQVNPINDEEQK